MKLPILIQGGMGIGVSGWRLANAVACTGQLGVVSGSAIDHVFSRRLQQGDPGGHLQAALAHFPVPGIVERILAKYFCPGGRPPGTPYRAPVMYRAEPQTEVFELSVVANFCEVFLAKRGHAGLVGINLLEKLQLPNPAALYGAMLAGVDFVLMGAGIPREIPGVLDRLTRQLPVSLKLYVEGAQAGDDFRLHFDPVKVMQSVLPALNRPRFLAIVASTTLALSLGKRTGGVDGFVIEGPTAGGHNAPPRGAPVLNQRGEPQYGPRDVVDLDVVGGIGLPFWLAGSYAHRDRVIEARAAGAQGVQVGTVFALCEESGLDPAIKHKLALQVLAGTTDVVTSATASPTGYPFKVASLGGTMSEPSTYQGRERVCDIGLLRTPYRREDGKLGFRCPAEPVATFVKRGGKLEDTQGRCCLCNGLLAGIGLGQYREGGRREPAIVTIGDDVRAMGRFYRDGKLSYTAREVVADLLGEAALLPNLAVASQDAEPAEPVAET
ncbi:MAG: nitronate monooxygenase [Candidatus Eisenbacteria bacterium]|nr:nitronate monooxygenase [Candidatus Eisenbacteria bacterium]